MRKQFSHIKFTFRLDPELKALLEEAANRNERTLSQEMTIRLRRSIRDEQDGKHLNKRSHI